MPGPTLSSFPLAVSPLDAEHWRESILFFDVAQLDCALLLQIMAVPPTYVDLGKSAKDVFTKGYGEQRNNSDTWSDHKPFDQERMIWTAMQNLLL